MGKNATVKTPSTPAAKPIKPKAAAPEKMQQEPTTADRLHTHRINPHTGHCTSCGQTKVVPPI